MTALSAPTSPRIGSSEPTEQSRIWQRFSKWFGMDASAGSSHEVDDQVKPSLSRRLSRRAVPGLPRPGTFKRQNSEKRERLLQVFPTGNERRTQSLDRRRLNNSMPSIIPDFARPLTPGQAQSQTQTQTNGGQSPVSPVSRNSAMPAFQPQIRPMPLSTPPMEPDEALDQVPELPVAPLYLDQTSSDQLDHIDKELEDKWILNLSMHFRDNSPREKFFVTFAETSTKWRRLTVSCDYRNAPADSLEQDLLHMTHQREKNAKIYEAIRTSLPDIQFYDTVTNLRLETDHEDRLHVHVTEDVNEVISYPTTTAVQHLEYERVDERDVVFDSHLSGFVYKVRINNEAFGGKVCVKKEIPGPDSVEEFLYEVNALHALIGTSNVIQFEGLVIDEENGLVKGLLISYANQGSMVDLIYDFKNSGALSWERKEKWARQMTYGLASIHEAGFVQGDCTLSNIVVDEYDDAMIIDINRRGCPVGWEPPEIHNMVDNGHRISMYIGIKSDLFQLGMSLWALIMEEEEPEKQIRPLPFSKFLDPSADMPADKKHLLEIVRICLSDKPRDRLSAERLLSYFPQDHSPLSDMVATPKTERDLVMVAPSDRETVYVDRASTAVEEYPSKHFHHAPRTPGFDNLPESVSTNSEEERRGRTPPHDGFAASRKEIVYSDNDPNDTVEPLIVSVSPGREPRYYGNVYDLHFDKSDDSLSQRVIRRRHRVPSLNDVMKTGDSSMIDAYVQRGLEHVDSGLDTEMVHEASAHSKIQFINKLDHIDSGLADMDADHVDNNRLQRSRTD